MAGGAVWGGRAEVRLVLVTDRVPHGGRWHRVNTTFRLGVPTAPQKKWAFQLCSEKAEMAVAVGLGGGAPEPPR